MPLPVGRLVCRMVSSVHRLGWCNGDGSPTLATGSQLIGFVSRCHTPEVVLGQVVVRVHGREPCPLHVRVYLPSLGKPEERIGKRVAGRFSVLTALTLLVRRGRSCVISFSGSLD